jgi:hypothetical protein
VTATFNAPYKLVMKTNGSGSVSSDPSGSTFLDGAVVTVTAVAAPRGYLEGLDRRGMLRLVPFVYRDDHVGYHRDGEFPLERLVPEFAGPHCRSRSASTRGASGLPHRLAALAHEHRAQGLKADFYRNQRVFA